MLDEIHARFWVGLEPLRKSGKLGAILLQYPDWFPIGSKNKAEILRARELLPDDTIAVEFRNRTWMEERNQAETLAFLRDNGLVHRIESRNAFVACVHNHAGEDLVVFLICERCGAVGEAPGGGAAEALKASSRAAGFTPKSPLIEIAGICSHCRER